jgi:phosphoribosylglycinamide formyltransferase-1
VGLERHDGGREAALVGLCADPGQDGLVTTVNAVEIADGHRAGAVVIEAWQGTVNSKNGFHIREFTILHCSSSGIFILTGPFSSRCRLVVLISGRGSNMQTIVNTINDRALPARVCAVISNRAGAEGLAWAGAQGIETRVVGHRDYASREEFDGALAQVIETYRPDYILLAGFMRVLTPAFVERFNGRILNIHPSLLPAFPGMHTHQQALAVGVQWHGCTIHFVTPVLDHGPIVAQGAVPVYAGDTPEILAARVLEVEHRLYAQVVCWLAEGRVSLDALQRVQVLGVASRSIVMAHEDAALK